MSEAVVRKMGKRKAKRGSIITAKEGGGENEEKPVRKKRKRRTQECNKDAFGFLYNQLLPASLGSEYWSTLSRAPVRIFAS